VSSRRMRPGRPEVVITGVGLVTPGGIGVAASWDAVCRGRSMAVADPRLSGLPVAMACAVPDFSATRHVGRRSSLMHDRHVQLAIPAAREAVADASLDPASWDGARVGVVIGNGSGGYASATREHEKLLNLGPNAVSALLIPLIIPNMVAGHLAMEFGATGPNLVTATACASGATAIGTAMRLLEQDDCDVVITGGTEAPVTPLLVAGFAQMGALSRRTDDPAAASRPFDADRDGFVIGEGSGILVMERAFDARARGARVRARLAGYGASADAHHMTAPDPDGRQVRRTIGAALADAGAVPADVDHVNAHGTSTPLNDAVEADTVRDLFGTMPAVTSAKGVVGHTLGAAGAIEAVLTVLSMENATVPPTANLVRLDPQIEIDVVAGEPRDRKIGVAVSHSFGFGGQNAVLVFTPS
jgi:beta-ketoacyl-acyl-carrier-protein synthase II